MSSLIFPAINLAILLGFLGYKLKGPLKEFFKSRSENLSKEVQEVQQLMNQAVQKYEEFSARIKSLDSELEQIRVASKNEIETLKVSLRKNAEDQAAILLMNHKRSLEEMRREARAQIVRETGLKIIESLESNVRSGLTPQDRAQMNVQFRTTLESMKPDGAKVGANQ